VTLRCSISAMASLTLSVVSGSKPCLVTSRNLKIALSISMHSSHMGSPLDWAGANGSQSPIWPGGMTDDAGATGRRAFGSAIAILNRTLSGVAFAHPAMREAAPIAVHLRERFVAAARPTRVRRVRRRRVGYPGPKKQGADGITTPAPYVAGQWGRGDDRLPG
jgi:hypothetical protein